VIGESFCLADHYLGDGVQRRELAGGRGVGNNRRRRLSLKNGLCYSKSMRGAESEDRT